MAVPGKRAEKDLSSTVYLASEEDFNLVCEPCHRDDQCLPAHGYCADCKEHLCETCFKHHRRATLSRHHTLLDKDSMPQSQQLSSASASIGPSDDFTTPCPKHKKEVIKFYCHDHNSLICNVCVTLEHTVISCRVSYIPDISEQAVNSEDYKNILEKINSLNDKCQNVTKYMKRMKTKSNNSVAEVPMAIEKFRKEINQRIDELEEEANDIAKTIQKENNEKTKSTETACDMVNKSLKTAADTIVYLNASKQADKLFMELKTAEQLIRDQEKTILDVTTSKDVDVKIFEFNQHQAISNLLQNKKPFGTVKYKTLTYSSSAEFAEPFNQPSTQNEAIAHYTPSSSHQEQPKQPSHLGEFFIKSAQDKKRCWITGMVLLPPDRLVITDCSNGCLKMFDTKKHFLVCQLQLAYSSCDVSLVGKNEIVVTHPDSKTIQYISASQNTLTEKHFLTVDGKCWGISCYKDKIVVSFHKPGKLQVLDMKGAIQTSVETKASGERILDQPRYIKACSKSIYVSDVGIITRLNWQGQVTGQYQNLISPRGLFLRDDQFLFVCDSNGKRNHIQEISSDFAEGKVVLKDLINPYTLCYCSTESKLYISSYTEKEDKRDDFLQVYRI